MKNDTVTKTVSFKEIMRPQFDLALNRPFDGNHKDFRILWVREGDRLTETGSRFGAPLPRKVISVKTVISSLEREYGVKVIDDMPQGVTFAE